MVFGCSGGWGQQLDDYKLAPGLLNGPDPIDGHGGGGGEEDESYPSVEKLLLDIRGAQESRETSLRLGGDKGAHTDSSRRSWHGAASPCFHGNSGVRFDTELTFISVAPGERDSADRSYARWLHFHQ